jgi:hypothetical protein
MPPPVRPPESTFVRFCECLNRFEVDYLVVGSEAVAFHAVPRYSVDFDVFVRPTSGNLLRVKAALEIFGVRELADQLDAHTWARTGATLRLGEPPLQIDVLLQLTGVEYHELSANVVRGQYGSVPVPFIGRADLIRNKKAAGRRIGRLGATRILATKH